MEEHAPGPAPGPGGFFGGQQRQHQQHHEEQENHEQRRPHGDDGGDAPGADVSSPARARVHHRASGDTSGVGGPGSDDGDRAEVGRTATTSPAPAGGGAASSFVRDPGGGDGWVCPHCVDDDGTTYPTGAGGQGRAQGWYFHGRGSFRDHAPPREFVEGHLAICPGYNRAVGGGGHNYHYQFAPRQHSSPPLPSPPTGTHHHPNREFLSGGSGSAPAWHGSPGPSAGYYAVATPTTEAASAAVPPSSLPPLQPPQLQHYHHPPVYHHMQHPPPPPPPPPPQLASQQGAYPGSADSSYGGYPTSPSHHPHHYQYRQSQQAQTTPTGMSSVAGTTTYLHHQPYPYAPLPPPPPPLHPSPHQDPGGAVGGGQLARASDEAASTSRAPPGPPPTRASESELEVGREKQRRRHDHRGGVDHPLGVGGPGGGRSSTLPTTGPARGSSSPSDTLGGGGGDGEGRHDHRATSPSSSSSSSNNLVLDFDKPLLTDYFYLMIRQLRFCRFEESDRKSRGRKRENVPVGFPGIECRHCATGASSSSSKKTWSSTTKPRRFFWANVDRLANSFAAISDHVTRCPNCPEDVRAALEEAKIGHREQMARLPKGSQKVFLRRMWRRLHPEREDRSDGDEEVDVVDANAGVITDAGEGTDELTTKSARMSPEVSSSVGGESRHRPSPAPSPPPDGGPSTRTRTKTKTKVGPRDQRGGGVRRDREDHQDDTRPPSSAPGIGGGGGGGGGEGGPATATTSQDPTPPRADADADASTRPPDSDARGHQRRQRQRQQQRVLLAISGDRQWLSDYDCQVRRSLEVFVATEEDVAAHRNDKRYPLRVGRVGLRCVYCASSSSPAGATGHAVSYPRCVNGIHEAVREIARLHLDVDARDAARQGSGGGGGGGGGGCQNMPPEVRERWRGLSESSTSLLSVLRPYYVIAAKALGLYDASDGVRCDGFHPTLQGSGPGSSPDRGSPKASSGVVNSSSSSPPYPSPERFSPVTGDGAGPSSSSSSAAAASKRGRVGGDDGGGATTETPTPTSDGTRKKPRGDRDEGEDSTATSASASIEGIMPHPV